MTYTEFIEALSTVNISDELKYDVLQYFVDNYPVRIAQTIKTPIGIISTGQQFWTALKGYDIKTDPLFNLEANYKKLANRKEEIIKFTENEKK